MADTKKKSGSAEPRGNVRVQTSGSSLDVEALRQIVEILEASEVTQLVWKSGREKLFIRRGEQAVTQVVQQLSPPAMPSAGVHLVPAAPQNHAPAAHHELKPRPSTPSRAAGGSVDPGDGKKGHLITSPFVGTFYRTPAPDQPPYVEVGATVKKGQILCIVEAMKLMNEIESEVAGRVSEILVQNAQPVEFGQQLFRIEPL